MYLRKDALEPEHPESTYNYIKNVLDKTPEDYGYYSSLLEPEQIKMMESIPTEALEAELNRRYNAFAQEEMFGEGLVRSRR